MSLISKARVGLAAGVAAVALMAAPAFASVSVSGTNGTTGNHSNNTNTVTVTQGSSYSLNNWSDIDNNICSGQSWWHVLSYKHHDSTCYFNTGYNESNKNTVGGSISTGDVGLMIDINNVANDGMGALLFAPSSAGNVSVIFSNNMTGNHSNNYNYAAITSASNLTIDNHANVDNDVSFTANTGHNDSNRNTVGGSVSTGDVHANVSVSNHLNGGGIVGTLGTGGSVTVSGGNSVTGANSINQNTVVVSQTNTASVDNHASIDNNIKVNANTGGNTASGNTQGGSISTGDASATITVHNTAN